MHIRPELQWAAEVCMKRICVGNMSLICLQDDYLQFHEESYPYLWYIRLLVVLSYKYVNDIIIQSKVSCSTLHTSTLLFELPPIELQL